MTGTQWLGFVIVVLTSAVLFTALTEDDPWAIVANTIVIGALGVGILMLTGVIV